MASIEQVYEIRQCVLCETRFQQAIENDACCPECNGYSDHECAFRYTMLSCDEYCHDKGPHVHVGFEIVESW